MGGFYHGSNGNTHVVLAGGGVKPLSEFLTSASDHTHYIATTATSGSSNPGQNITGTGNITSNATNTYALGASDNVWTNVYSRGLISDDALNLQSGTGDDILVKINGGTEAARFTSGKRFGFGTTSPSVPFHIAGTGVSLTNASRNMTVLTYVQGTLYSSSYVESKLGIIVNNSASGTCLSIRANNKECARVDIQTIGTAGNGTAPGEQGVARLILGNSVKMDDSTTTDGANNAKGVIYLYGSNNHYHILEPGAPAAQRYHYFPNSTGWIVTGGNGTSTGKGDTSTPVYLKTNGVLDTCTSIDASTLGGTALSGLLTAFSGGGISSSGNTLTQANHSITVGGTTLTAGSSTASIINSLSVSKLTSSVSTSLTAAITVNGQASSDKTLTNVHSPSLSCRTSILTNDGVLVHYKGDKNTTETVPIMTPTGYSSALTMTTMGDYTKVYFPTGATTSTNKQAQVLRLIWNVHNWKEFYSSPNSKYLFYRGVVNDTVLKWHIIPMIEYENANAPADPQASLGSATEPVYINSGKFVKCNPYPNGVDLSPAIGAGSASNTVKITVGGIDSSDYTIPYATVSGSTIWLTPNSSYDYSYPNGYTVNKGQIETLVPSNTQYTIPGGPFMSLTLSQTATSGASYSLALDYNTNMYICYKATKTGTPTWRRVVTNSSENMTLNIGKCIPGQLILGGPPSGYSLSATGNSTTFGWDTRIYRPQDKIYYEGYNSSNIKSFLYFHKQENITNATNWKRYICLPDPANLEEGMIIYIECNWMPTIIGIMADTHEQTYWFPYTSNVKYFKVGNNANGRPFCIATAYVDNSNTMSGTWADVIKVNNFDTSILYNSSSYTIYNSSNKLIRLFVTTLPRGNGSLKVYRILT